MIRKTEERQQSRKNSEESQPRELAQDTQNQSVLFIGPVKDRTLDTSVKSFFAKNGLKIAIRERVSRKKNKFIVADVDESQSTRTANEFFNTFQVIDGEEVRVRRLKQEQFGKRDDPAYNIFVGNLPREVTRKEISDFFKQYGAISRVDVKKKSRKNNYAISFITFERKEVAEFLREVKELKFQGRVLYIRDTDTENYQKMMKEKQAGLNPEVIPASQQQPSRLASGFGGENQNRLMDNLFQIPPESSHPSQPMRSTGGWANTARDNFLEQAPRSYPESVPSPHSSNHNLRNPDPYLNVEFKKKPQPYFAKNIGQGSNPSSQSEPKVLTHGNSFEEDQRTNPRRTSQIRGHFEFSGSSSRQTIPPYRQNPPLPWGDRQEPRSLENLPQRFDQDRGGVGLIVPNTPQQNYNNNLKYYPGGSQDVIQASNQGYEQQQRNTSLQGRYNPMFGKNNYRLDPQVQDANSQRKQPKIQVHSHQRPSSLNRDQHFSYSSLSDWNREGRQNPEYGARIPFASGREAPASAQQPHATRNDAFHQQGPGRQSTGPIASEGRGEAGFGRRDSSRPHFWRFFNNADQHRTLIREDRQMAFTYEPDRKSPDEETKLHLTAAKLRRISISHQQKGNMRFNYKVASN